MSLQVLPATAEVVAGDTLRFRVEAQTRSGNVLASPTGLRWGVSDSTMATIDASGHLRALRTGPVQVEARVGDLYSLATVQVRQAPPLLLSDTSVLLVTIGDTLRLQGAVSGSAARNLRVERLSEHRWLGEQEVARLSSTGVSVIAAGPGEAVFRVSAWAAEPALLRVVVRPSEPVLFSVVPSRSVVGTGDTVRLRGYVPSLSAESIRVGGARAQVLGRDSANVLIAARTVPLSTCAEPARAEVSLTQGRVVGPLSFLRKREGEISPAVGTAVWLSAAQLACLRTAPHEGAEYLLGFSDPSRIDDSRTVQLPYRFRFTFQVSVRDQLKVSGASGASASARSETPSRFSARSSLADVSGHHHPQAQVQLQAQSQPRSHPIFDRATPWTVGDVFSYRPMISEWGTSIEVQVVAIHDGNWVIAMPVEDVAGWTGARAAAFDTAATWMRSHGFFMLEDALEPGRPSAGASGQMLTVVRYSPDQGGGGRASGQYFEVGYREGWTPTWWLNLIAHEFTHLWHGRYRHENARRTSPNMTQGYGGMSMWNTEGLANYVADEALRRYAGMPFLENVEPDFRQGPAHLWMQSIHGSPAHLIGGYQTASNFLRDLTQRLVVERRMSHQDAFVAVARGVAADWWGCASFTPGFDCVMEGLVPAMRRHLGAEWDPTGAMLTWMFSQAADDLTGSATYQNLTFRDVHRHGVGFGPLKVLRAGEGEQVAREIYESGSGHVRLVDDGQGGVYQATSSLPNTRWQLFRLR
ncbi:MAG: Ig-like domain-containing protein [Gemmatimonadetes bacterium]|nr:Ig-like domain-containing protein [Gemmatimonadota bacterium]